MKAKINIEIWDETTQQKLDDLGVTNKFVKTIYEAAFKSILDGKFDGCEYSLDVEVTDEVSK